MAAAPAFTAATPAFTERVDPNCAIDTVSPAAARAASVRPGPSWPNRSTQARGSGAVSRRTAPGVLSTATTASPCAAAKAASPATSAWWCTAT